MRDNMYECEAKRLVVRDGVKVREWRLTRVTDVIANDLVNIAARIARVGCDYTENKL